MKKSIVTIATVSVIGFGSSFFVQQPVHAETLSQLHNKQAEIQDQRSQIKSNLSKAEAQIADLLIDLEELNNEISINKKALQSNEKQLKDTDKQITSKEDEIEELQASIDKRYEILKQRAVSYQQSGGNISYLDVIFGSTSFGDFITRVTAVTKISESDQEIMGKIEADKVLVENKLTELEDMKTELEGMKDLILEQKQENEKRQEKLKKKESELTKKAKELKIKDRDLASLESSVKSSIASSQRSVATVSSSASSRSTSAPSTSSSSHAASNNAGASFTANPATKADVHAAIRAGYTVLGTPYVWGGKSPGGFDCSGFVSWAFGQAGYSIPSSTSGLSSTGTKVSESNLQPGDLVFFNTYKTNGHVGIYVGGGQFIGAQSSRGVSVVSMNEGYWKNRFSGHVRRLN